MADNLLGTFLRERREATRPEQVGLPAGGRRRTPGLRRAELATLSGVSVDYLTRLEQGRDTRPSAAVLAALADTLLLSQEEREILLHLGVASGNGEMCPRNDEPAESVRPSVLALLAGMEPSAAVVINRLGDVLAATDGWVTLFGAIGLADAERPNLVRHLFTDPRARSAFLDWDRVADDAVVTIRSMNRADDPHLAVLVEEIGATGQAELAARMQAGPGAAPLPGVVRLEHPAVGELRLAVESFDVKHAEQQLVTYLPADEATADALDELRRSRSGVLRAVPG